MIKAKVLVTFTDKYSGEECLEGSVIDISVERFNEIILKGNFLQIVEEEPKKEKSRRSEE